MPEFKKDMVEAILATIIILAYIWLVLHNKASIEGFVAIATLVIRRYLDGITEQEKNNNKKGDKSK